MAKKKLEVSVTVNGKPAENIVEALFSNNRSYKIREASLKDGFCNYAYEIVSGPGCNDIHKVVGSKMIMGDMIKAFEKLHVHLACVDETFKHANVEIDDIDKFHGHEITGFYAVHGIKLKGSDENLGVVLIGTKYIQTVGGRLELVTPKIPIDGLSSYKWYNELRDAVALITEEVSLYKEGKFLVTEEHEEEHKPRKKSKQLSIADALDEVQDAEEVFDEDSDDLGDDEDIDFETGKI